MFLQTKGMLAGNEAGAKLAAIYQSGIDWVMEYYSRGAQNSMLKWRAETICKPTMQQRLQAVEAMHELTAISEELISYIATRFCLYSGTVNYDDIISAGRVGLIQSLLYFDPESDLLSFFAVPYIQEAIFSFILEHMLGSARFAVDA